MVQLQIMSDLHLESPKAYDIFEIVPKAPHLALLGDIGVIVKDKVEYLAFISRQLRQFRTVLLVLGNHEAYGSTWPETVQVIREYEHAQRDRPGQGNFVLLDRDSFELRSDQSGRTIILGCSLFSHVPSDQAMAVELGLADFFQTTSWTVKDHNKAHERDLAWLNAQVNELEKDDSVRRVVVLSHWSPTIDPRSIDPRHSASRISSGFMTDLSQQACTTASKVAMWASGHTHYNCDFDVKRHTGCNIHYYTNQRGYYFSQAANFALQGFVEL